MGALYKLTKPFPAEVRGGAKQRVRAIQLASESLAPADDGESQPLTAALVPSTETSFDASNTAPPELIDKVGNSLEQIVRESTRS